MRERECVGEYTASNTLTTHPPKTRVEHKAKCFKAPARLTHTQSGLALCPTQSQAALTGIVQIVQIKESYFKHF